MNKNYLNLFRSSLLASGLVIGSSALTPAFAVGPNLQLDILGGSYDPTDESVFLNATGDVDLFAYCNPERGRNGNNCIDQNHFLAIGVLDINGNAVANGFDFGSFNINGVDYTFSDLTFGIPPLDSNVETAANGDNSDLQTHSVFPTLFTELAFSFVDDPQRTDINVQDNPGTDPNLNLDADTYFHKFDVNVSGLLDGYRLHFDLYNTDCVNAINGGSDCSVEDFAPFSHDAYVVDGGDNPQGVPEPGTSLALGLLAFGSLASAKKKKA